MAVSVPAVPNIENHTINEELDLNTFSQRGFKLDENQTAVADTTLTTQAEIHHQYSNDDTPGHSGDTEEGQDHQYASEGNSSRGATGPDPQQVLEQPASQINEIESDEEIRPYGIAAANSAYEDTNLYQNECVPGSDDPAVNENEVKTAPSVSRNSLYEIACMDSNPKTSPCTMARNSTAEDLGILYGHCPAMDG
ncbi:hypothetical protein Bbelb_040090 [Branchiostoma belcheri]|nr:hypothetical protein Bbelb_040090 [Branchiostoma belcheri]